MHWFIIMFIFINGTGDDKRFRRVEFPVPDVGVCLNLVEQMNKDKSYYVSCDYRD